MSSGTGNPHGTRFSILGQSAPDVIASGLTAEAAYEWLTRGDNFTLIDEATGDNVTFAELTEILGDAAEPAFIDTEDGLDYERARNNRDLDTRPGARGQYL